MDKSETVTEIKSKPIDFPIYAMIASHINHSERFSNFISTIESIRDQTTAYSRRIKDNTSYHKRPNALFLGISVPDDEFFTMVCDYLRQRGRFGFPILYCVRIGTYSQMENYKCVFSKYEDALNNPTVPAWLIFGDDDDLWDRDRVQTYMEVLNSNLVSEHTSALRCTTFRDKGVVGNHTTDGYRGNYQNYLVKSSIFGKFLQKASSQLLKHKFADVYWITCLHKAYANNPPTPKNIVQFTCAPETKRWMYDWRHVDYPHASGAESIQLDNIDEELLTLIPGFDTKVLKSLRNSVEMTVSDNFIPIRNAEFAVDEVLKKYNDALKIQSVQELFVIRKIALFYYGKIDAIFHDIEL